MKLIYSSVDPDVRRKLGRRLWYQQWDKVTLALEFLCKQNIWLENIGYPNRLIRMIPLVFETYRTIIVLAINLLNKCLSQTIDSCVKKFDSWTGDRRSHTFFPLPPSSKKENGSPSAARGAKICENGTKYNVNWEKTRSHEIENGAKRRLSQNDTRI